MEVHVLIDLGDDLTNRRMRALDKRLQSIYTQAYEQAVKNNEKAIEKLGSLPEDTPKDKRTAFYREVKRTTGMVDNISSELARAGDTAAKIIQGEMTGVFNLNYEYANYTICSQSGLDLNFAIYDRNQIAAILQEEQSPFTKIAYKKMGSDRIITQRLGNALAIATINGESQEKLIKRIRDVTGQSYKQARRVAQTERTRVQSQGRNQSIADSVAMGINMAKEWIARMRNTRDLHAMTNHEIVPADEEFSNGLLYPGDPNGAASNVVGCFCSIVPKVLKPGEKLVKNTPPMQDMSFAKYEEKRNPKVPTIKPEKVKKEPAKAQEKAPRAEKTIASLQKMTTSELKQSIKPMATGYYMQRYNLSEAEAARRVNALLAGATKTDLIKDCKTISKKLKN